VGYVDGDGCLVVVGRLDDCVRTSAGHVVSPAVIAEVLDGYPGIADAVVVALGPAAQPALAALIESVPPIDLAAVHAHLTRVLPASLRPRVLDQVQALPRLSSGKPDRMACIAMLERSSLRSR
jgi:acyl-CoA synthetase (AMP-forming)/AMP-acid ligase II